MATDTYQEEITKILREAFDEVDTDKNGSICHNELKVMLHKAGYDATDKMIQVGILNTYTHRIKGSL